MYVYVSVIILYQIAKIKMVIGINDLNAHTVTIKQQGKYNRLFMRDSQIQGCITIAVFCNERNNTEEHPIKQCIKHINSNNSNFT